MAETMNQETTPIAPALRTPRAAAVAGILFSVLYGAVIVLSRLAIPEGPGNADVAALPESSIRAVRFALALMPWAGIAFLWFMGVMRSRVGRLEDQFFSTIFFGSGLLLLAMGYTSAALGSGILSTFASAGAKVVDNGVLLLGRSVMYTVANIYGIRMSGMFMLSLGTIWVRTRVMPRLFVALTYVLALFLLLGINLSLWTQLIFPAWVLAVSIFILVASRRSETAEGQAELGAVG